MNSQTFQPRIVYFFTGSELETDRTCKLWPWKFCASPVFPGLCMEILPEHLVRSQVFTFRFATNDC